MRRAALVVVPAAAFAATLYGAAGPPGELSAALPADPVTSQVGTDDWRKIPFSDVIDTMGTVVCAEARGEPQEGRHAVAWTMINRWRTGRWRTMRDVAVRGGYALSCPAGTEPLAAARSYLDALDVIEGRVSDPTGGAVSFYAPAKVPPPRWAFACEPIGAHNFCFVRGL